MLGSVFPWDLEIRALLVGPLEARVLSAVDLGDEPWSQMLSSFGAAHPAPALASFPGGGAAGRGRGNTRGIGCCC